MRAADKDEGLPLDRKAGEIPVGCLESFHICPPRRIRRSSQFSVPWISSYETLLTSHDFSWGAGELKEKQEKREKLSRQPLCDSGLRCAELEKKRVPESAEKIYNMK